MIKNIGEIKICAIMATTLMLIAVIFTVCLGKGTKVAAKHAKTKTPDPTRNQHAKLAFINNFEDPQGGRPPPHFYSRRFCRSVYRRTQSIQRTRNVKGNFAWGSYGGFLAGSWRNLGGTSASSRLNLGKFLAKPRQVLGGPKSLKATRKAA